MSNIKYRAVIKLFTQKGLNATEISKELDSVYKDDAPSHCTVAKCLAGFKEPERAFEDSPLMDRPSTIATDQNTDALEWMVMRDGQLSVRRIAY